MLPYPSFSISQLVISFRLHNCVTTGKSIRAELVTAGGTCVLVEWTVKDGLFSYFFTLYEVTESPDAYMPFVIRTQEVSRRTL